MIIFSPPKVMPYAPSTQPIAQVAVGLNYDEQSNRTFLRFNLLDPKGRQIQIDTSSLPQPTASQAQMEAFQNTPTVAGQTFLQDLDTRALPILETCYGLTGGTIE